MVDLSGVPDLELTTPRLLLRPWRPEDADAVFTAMQDRRMHEFLRLPDPYTRADALEFTAVHGNDSRTNGTGIGGPVVERSSGRVVGSAELRFPPAKLRGADIGYAIYPWGQGQGYAAEATRALVDWAHAHGMDRVELRCAVTNLASAKTALNAGFAFEGLERGQLTVPAGITDAARFARLAGDSGDPVAPVFPPVPDVSDGVVRLRALRVEDAEALWEQDIDPATVASGMRGTPPTRDEVSVLARRAGLDHLVGSTTSLVVEEVATGAFAGMIRLSFAGPPQVGRIGYVMHPAFRGRGYTARGLRLMAPWAFGPVGMARLELGAKITNEASQRVALAAGFVADGVRAARLRNADGTFSDEARFALLR